LTNVDVLARVRELRVEQSRKTGVNADRVLREVAKERGWVWNGRAGDQILR